MTFDDNREQAFEAGFVHDEELRFRALAKRNHRIGAWAATKIGKSGTALHDYVEDIVTLGLEEKGEPKIVARLSTDFSAANVTVSTHQIERMMDEMYADAIIEVKRSL